MFTISFINSITCFSNLINSRFYTEGFDSKISRQDKIKHSKKGEKHLIKIVTLLWRVSTKIMQQSEQQALNKFSTRKGKIFWLYNAKWFTCTRCSSICVPAAPNALKYVESLSQLFESCFCYYVRGL